MKKNNILIEYLDSIINCEEQKYISKSIIQEYRSYIKNLGIPCKCEEPIKMKYDLKSVDRTYVPFSDILIIAAIIIFFSPLELNLYISTLLTLISIFIETINYVSSLSHVKKYVDCVNREIEEIYNSYLIMENRRIESEKELIKKYKVNISSLTKDIKKLEKGLERLYSLNILKPKYRNYVSICSVRDNFLYGKRNSLSVSNEVFSKSKALIMNVKGELSSDVVATNLKGIKTSHRSLYNSLVYIRKELKENKKQIDEEYNNNIESIIKYSNGELDNYMFKCENNIVDTNSRVISHISNCEKYKELSFK